MIKNLISFIGILVIVIVSFSSIFNILYRSQQEEFHTILISVRYLIASSMGNFTFDSSNFVSSVILIGFLFLTNIVLLNLLVALLTNTYTEILQRGNMEYSLIIFYDYCKYKYNKYYASLINVYAPGNAINVLALPFLIFKKQQSINQIFELIQYNIFMFLPCFIGFLVGNLILLPLTYL